MYPGGMNGIHPVYGNGDGTGRLGGTLPISRTTPAPAPPQAQPQQTTPEYLSTLFPGGLPQSNYDVSPQSELNAVLQNLAPIFGQQQRGLQDALANAGIVGGSTAGAVGDLSRQQTSQATSSIAPLMQAAQQMGLNQSEFNTGNQLSGGEFDASTFNQMLSQMLGFKNNDWLAQLQAQMGLAQGAASGQTGAFQPVFSQPSAPNFMQLGSAFAPSSTGGPSVPGGMPGMGGGGTP